MQQKNVYIKPSIKFYTSFSEMLSTDPTLEKYIFGAEEKWEFKDLFNFPKTFIIAEPGYGKTRLINEIVLEAKKNGRKAISIECKKIIETTVEESMSNSIQKSLGCEPARCGLKNEEKSILCFDALDEIKYEDFSRMVEKIKIFLQKYNKTTVFISCRLHFFKRFKDIFNELEFRYARILPFEKEKVKVYLKENAIKEKDIERILEILSFQGRDLVIQTPRYLELLVDYVRERGIINVGEMTKSELFEYFIYKKLEIEDEKHSTQIGEVIKNVLEKLALIMEIYQTNTLTKDEFTTFFDDLKSDLKTSLLPQVINPIFYEKTLLKGNNDSIEFDNTEFQEYLAAKEIIRLGKNKRTIFELSVDPDIREIYPSWFNTLSFVVDKDISILKPLLDFGRTNNKGIIQDKEFHRFLTKVDVNRLTREERKEIFEQIFEYYQTLQLWIDWDVLQNLIYYFDRSQQGLLKKYVDRNLQWKNETNRFVSLGNIAELVGFLFTRDVFSPKERAFWKNRLIEFAKDKNENGVLQRNALFALGNLKDDSLIEEVECVWESKDRHIKDAFLQLCIVTNPNHKISIKYFIEGTKSGILLARAGLCAVNSAHVLKDFLNACINDSLFLFRFLEHEGIYEDKDRQIIENIKSVWDNDIEDKLKTLIQKAFVREYSYQAENSNFLKNIVLILKSKDESYLFVLISQIKQSITLSKYIFIFGNIFSALLEISQVERFINELEQFQNGRYIALRTLQRVNISKRRDKKEIYEEGRKYLYKEYKEAESYLNQKKKAKPDDQIYSQFKFKLQPEKDHFSTDVFKFYLSNKEKLKPYIKRGDIDRMKNLIEDVIFSKFDPGDQDMKIISRGKETTSYEIHPRSIIFGDCIEVARDLDLDVTKYRKNIIRYIPYARDEELDTIFLLIPDINKHEIEALLSIYKNKKSDLWRFLPETLVRASRKYVIREAIPFLREFIDLDELSIYVRIQALVTADFLVSDENVLKNIFKKYKKTKSEESKLAKKANELLIERHGYKDAIKWRFDELKRSAIAFQEPTGVHEVNEYEHELRHKEFAAPIMRLKQPRYEKYFLNLLEKSFSLLKKEGYWSYVTYLWQIVYSYFDNRKEERSYKPSKILESFVQKHSSIEGLNWFNDQLVRLRHSYMTYIGKPMSVGECINKYNQLKSQQYLKISNSMELYEEIKDVIEVDLRQWVESEGAYSFIVGGKINEKSKRQSYEELIQKTIKSQFAYSLCERGFRKTDIVREPQLLQRKQVDFRISYGFIGPILIEVKLSTNRDLNSRNLRAQTSYKNLFTYMDGFKAHFGIFLVIDNKARTPQTESWETHRAKILAAYQQIKNVTVLDLRCIPQNSMPVRKS